jgi:spore coat polysaccharide biosynthesis protein SpsF (cytidylyltransferase family)
MRESVAATIAIVQARTSSSRLRGKVLIPILGEPMLIRHIERLRCCKEIDLIRVATSSDPSDDALAAVCDAHNVSCFRGSLDDVLDRFVQAARPYRPDVVVRLTGDCPLADPTLIDDVIRYFRAGDYDYVCNFAPPTFPDGLDVEVVRFTCLEQAAQEAVLPSHREHVTPFLRAHPERYRLGNLARPVDLSHLRWTVDEPEDFEFVRRVYERLYPTRQDFSTNDILNLIEQEPALQAINARFTRNEGARKSLQADAEYFARHQ